MAVAKTNDQRGDVRDERFSGAFSCKLVFVTGDGRIIAIRPMDVSRRGLGFIAKEPLKVGQGFWLLIQDYRFRVELAYCGSHLGIEGLFRCGLFLREAEGNLHAVCIQAGLLADEHAKSWMPSLYARGFGT